MTSASGIDMGSVSLNLFASRSDSVPAEGGKNDSETSSPVQSQRRRIPLLRLSFQDILDMRSQRKRRKKSAKSRSSSDGPDGSGAEIENVTHTNVSYNSFEKLTCSVCFLEMASNKFPILLLCEHRCCLSCLQSYLITEISDSRVYITCPECPKMIHPNDIRSILDDRDLFEKYESFMLRRHLTCEPDMRWCPAADCHYGVIAAGCASCPKLKCERSGCNTYFCYHCRQLWHPNKTCDDAKYERGSMILRSSSNDVNYTMDTKPCPRCSALISKMEDGTCNHMTCVICGAEFCWLCMKQISDLHYLSPSGCTFWGKKPWSRKKKILWQIGILIGAPLGIALIAGLTIPAMMIGIPIYVGRRLYKRHSTVGYRPYERNAIVAFGVCVSILVAPLLAALTVSVGVPVLLAYVYGVVPISLCRTGGCGISKTENGVRLDLDEQTSSLERGSTAAAAVPSRQSSSAPLAKKESLSPDRFDKSSASSPPASVPNASGDSWGKARSASGINMENVGREMDCVSNTAIAGESLSGSICGSTGYNPVIKIRKHSYSSDSVNYSLCDNVSNITYPESLAGVIIDGSGLGGTRTSAAVHHHSAQSSAVPPSVDVHQRGQSCDSDDPAVAVASVDGDGPHPSSVDPAAAAAHIPPSNRKRHLVASTASGQMAEGSGKHKSLGFKLTESPSCESSHAPSTSGPGESLYSGTGAGDQLPAWSSSSGAPSSPSSGAAAAAAEALQPLLPSN